MSKMHGLIFATWEKFLGDQYGEVILGVYKAAIEGTEAAIPVVSRSYDDAVLLRGAAAVSKVTGIDVSAFLREYGRYFITNRLTNHICAHILESVHSARELLLAMRSVHKQLHIASTEVIPPAFSYTPLSGDDLRISYDSHRQLCPLLCGAIEGAAILFGEAIAIDHPETKTACMRYGASECLLDVFFMGETSQPLKNAGGQVNAEHDKLRELVFHMLPSEGRGLTLHEVSALIAMSYGISVRPTRVASIIMKMQNVGLVFLSAKQHGDLYCEREYLRVSKCETEAGRLLVVNVS